MRRRREDTAEKKDNAKRKSHYEETNDEKIREEKSSLENCKPFIRQFIGCNSKYFFLLKRHLWPVCVLVKSSSPSHP